MRDAMLAMVLVIGLGCSGGSDQADVPSPDTASPDVPSPDAASPDAASATDAAADGAPDARYALGATYPCGSDTCTVGVSDCRTTLLKFDAGVISGCYPLEGACAQTPTCACLGYLEGMPGSVNWGICACASDEGRVNVVCPQI